MPRQIASSLLVLAAVHAVEASTLDTNRIEQITGLKGA
jgi:hypothetical protein